MLARTWPDSNSEVQRKDVAKIFRAIANNIPGLLQEMNPGRAAEKLARKRNNLSADVHPLRADGPILTHHILTFAAKRWCPSNVVFESTSYEGRNSKTPVRSPSFTINAAAGREKRRRPVQIFICDRRTRPHVILRLIQQLVRSRRDYSP